MAYWLSRLCNWSPRFKSFLLFSHQVMYDSLRPHGLQYTAPPCPSLSLGVCSNSCPLSQWCYLITSSSTAPFFCLQSFPASGSFPVSQLFTSGGQSIGASASVLSMNIQEMQELWETNELGLFEAICINCSISCIRPLGLKCSGWRGRGLSWDQRIRQKSTKK